MKFEKFLKEQIVCLDGGMGTLLLEKGLLPGEAPEKWNLSHSEIITAIHKDYYDAGSNVVCTNTFGINPLKYKKEDCRTMLAAAVANAKKAKAESVGSQEKFIALDIGPLGQLIKPLGSLDFEEAVQAFSFVVQEGTALGVDLILIETINDSYETKAALLAAKENAELPVLVSNAYDETGKLMTGADPKAMVALLEGMGVAGLGANCSLGPKQLEGVVQSLLEASSLPVLCKPNAGLPCLVNGETCYHLTAEEFALEMEKMVKIGVRIVGGCCGTTPAFIRAMKERITGLAPKEITPKEDTTVSSYTHAVAFEKCPILIGERINPTGKKRMKEALKAGETDYLLQEATKQAECGVDILDVNVGLPDIDESAVLAQSVREIQAVTDLPLQIDSADITAMEKALRVYNGKALINSVNGKKENMEQIFPLVKKYGGVVVALTLDESGIPETAEGRLAIAKKILETAETYGISKKDLLFDPLAMAVSADEKAALVTLESVRLIHQELGCHTSLGVSNVSFGLPARESIGSVFFAMALQAGLSAAIMNPYAVDMMRVYTSYLALTGQDTHFEAYTKAAAAWQPANVAAPVMAATEPTGANPLQEAILQGRKEKAAAETARLLENTDPLAIINDEIIPALNQVGEGFEQKKVYLPQLLMSAEAAKAAFGIIKERTKTKKGAEKGVFVLATVKGDIHDIGKNIVRLLLENFGFQVIDLGKDVAPEAVMEAVLAHKAPLVGLSALMTTTLPAMEETIRLLKEKAPFCRCVVGGAVLTKEYAAKIGADKYAKDAMEAVRFAEDAIKAN